MDRLTVNTGLRNYALFGAQLNQGANYNKIFPTVDLLSSFLYSQESISFSVKWGTGVPKEQSAYGETMRRKTHELWHDTDTDRLFGDAVFWSLVYNSYFIKTLWNGGLRTYGVAPHFVGVYREDIPNLDNQEAITHLYYSTRSGLRTLTRFLGAKKQAEIMEHVSTLGPIDESMAPQTVSQVIVNAQRGGAAFPNAPISGTAQPLWNQRFSYNPEISPDLIEMREVWVYDDDLEDYRVFTIANPNVVIFDRPGEKLCTKGEHPFTKVTPFGLPDYFWGLSLVQNLLGLQDWHESHLERVDTVFRRILRPSRIFTGPWTGLTDERMLALDKEGGHFQSAMPNAKVDTYKPEVDMAMALNYLHEIDQMFNEMAGIGGNIMRAEGDEGVRSMQHAQILQRMGSSRIKKTAMTIEAPAERQATLMMKIQRDHDKEKYLDDNQKEFLLAQASGNFTIKVTGHSLSPVFVEDTKAEAKQLVAMKAMDRKRYLQQTNPPMEDELERDLETKIEPAEAQQAKVQMGLQLMKAGKGKI
jgi:hypothetical protein